MRNVGIVRKFSQKLAIGPFRFGQLSGLMQLDGPSQA